MIFCLRISIFWQLILSVIPGKALRTALPASGYDYGRWAGEVIDQLGFDRISLFGGSFGGVIERAEKIIPNCTTYLLRGRGHMHYRYIISS